MSQKFDKAVESVKNGQQLFVATEDLIQNQLDDFQVQQNFSNSTVQYGSIVVFVLLGLLIVAMAYALIKIHRLTLIVLALTRTADADILPAVPPVWIYQHPTAPPVNVTNTGTVVFFNFINSDNWFEITIIFILSVMYLSWLVLKLIKRYRKRGSVNVYLGLQISNDKFTIVLKWFKLLRDLNDYQIMILNTNKTVELVRSCFWPKLSVNWQITINTPNNIVPIMLPKLVPVPITMLPKIRSLIGNNKFYTLMLVTCHTNLLLRNDNEPRTIIHKSQVFVVKTIAPETQPTAPSNPEHCLYPRLPSSTP